MSLDYPPLNPQPVTFSGGSVHVTNLADIDANVDLIEGYVASIDGTLSDAATGVDPINVNRTPVS